MKIGFLVDKISFGGGERILKMLIDEFSIRGHTIMIYSWNKEWLNYTNDNHEIYVLENPPIGLKGKITAYINLKKQLLLTSPNCLMIFSLGLAEVGVFAARRANIPTILSERVDPKFLPKSKIHRLLRLVVYSICSGIVFQTFEVRNYFPENIRKKSIVVQNPIMDDKLPPPNTGNVKKEIVAIGRLSVEKNFSLLINAFAELRIPEYTLRIFGDGPLFDDLSKLINSLGMDGCVKLEGNVNRVVEYIQNSDIFILSSNHEGMPNALIEAMAMGLACISTDFSSGGARSLIINEVNGLLVSTNNLFELKNAILKLTNNPEFKQKIKLNALKIRDTNSKECIIPIWIKYIESYL